MTFSRQRPRWFSLLQFLVVSGIRTAWRSSKNFIKRLLGLEPYFDETGLFWRQFVLHLLGIRPIHALTCVRRRGLEGAGSQALLIINAITIARLAGLKYVHTPFQTIHHADRPMDEWVGLWEKFFNLGEGELSQQEWDGDLVNYCYNAHEIEFCLGLDKRRDEQISVFKSLLPDVRRKYHQGKCRKAHEANDELVIGVHIRRGDVSAVSHSYRFIRSETILQTINSITSVLAANGVRHKTRVYSQGVAADFEEFAFPGVELFLDSDPAWTMQELIEADVLIIDKGYFSFYAALISDGIKVFFGDESFSISEDYFVPSSAWQHHPLTEDWLPCKKDGCFDEVAFERQLSIRVHSS